MLRKPQIDIKNIVTNASVFEESLVKRRLALPGGMTMQQLVDRLSELRDLQFRKQQLLTERNRLQAQFGKQRAANQDTAGIESQLRELKRELADVETRADAAETETRPVLEAVPNTLAPESAGLEAEEVIGEIWPDRRVPETETRRHDLVGERLGLVDFESATTVAGPSSYFLLGAGALLEQALVQFALSRCVAAGWKPVAPPSLARVPVALACGFRPRDDNGPDSQIYTLRGDDDLCLSGTAEIPLAGLAAQRTLDKPARVVGVSRSYRAEAGARGRDSKGLYRVHEFTKVEMFAWTTPDASAALHDEILALEKGIISDLGLCARVLHMPPSDLGAPAAKKYDIEAWMPGRGGWGELTSTSNCLDYQARRLHTRIRDPSAPKPVFAHTLNGTACAVPRTIVALIEQHYDPSTDRVLIPEALRPFMGGIDSIGRQPHPLA